MNTKNQGDLYEDLNEISLILRTNASGDVILRLAPDGTVISTECFRCHAVDAVTGTCPYAYEIHGDLAPCICCDDCRYQCAMDT